MLENVNRELVGVYSHCLLLTMLQSNLEPKIQQKILKDPALNSDNNKSWHLLSRRKHWTAARILCFLVQSKVSLIEGYNASKCRFFFFTSKILDCPFFPTSWLFQMTVFIISSCIYIEAIFGLVPYEKKKVKNIGVCDVCVSLATHMSSLWC